MSGSSLASLSFAGITLLVPAGLAQQFAELGKLHLPPIPNAGAAMAAADIDGDRDLDLLVYDSGRVRVWTNDGAGIFTASPSTRWGGSCLAVADVDRDGDVDLVLGNPGILYLNDGRGSFTAPANPFPGLVSETRGVAVGDVDGDGDVDVVFANGWHLMGAQEQLFLNDGAGHFALAASQLVTSLDDSHAVALADVDGDGDLDLVVGNDWDWSSGTIGDHNALYLNDGHGNFTDATGQLSPWLGKTAAIALGDVDGDGDLDLVCADRVQNRLSRNDGHGWFLDDLTALPAGSATAVTLGDVDGDQDLDLMFGGGTMGALRLLLNDGMGRFSDASAVRLPDTYGGRVLLCDVDGDGDLDCALGAQPDRLYLNDGDGFFADGSARQLPNGIESAVAAAGDVDGDGDLDVVLLNRLHINDGRGWFTSRPMPRAGSGIPVAMALGDVDGDGDLDCVIGTVGGRDGLLSNDGLGTFTDVSATRLPAINDSTSGVALADVDGDGDLDLACANSEQHRLLINDGSGYFADGTAARLPVNTTYAVSVVCGDVDGDGDVDLAFGGSDRWWLYRNAGGGYFTDVSTMSLPGGGNTRLTIGDVDGDGDLDIVCAVSGQDRLFLNDGSGTFTDVTATHLPAVADATNRIVLADFDLDGDLDMYFANGPSVSLAEQSRLCLNDGLGRFAEATQRLPVHRVATVAVAVGDVDGDGDPDIFCSNDDSDTGLPNRLWLNLFRQCHAPWLLRVGYDWALDVIAQPGFATTPWFALPMLAPATARIPVPPFGTLGLDPGQLVLLPPVVVPVPGGSARTRIAVPGDPSLLGVRIHGQAILFASAETTRLTNVTADTVLR